MSSGIWGASVSVANAPGQEAMSGDEAEETKQDNSRSEESGDSRGSSEIDEELPTAEQLAKKKTGRFLKTKKYLASRAASSRAVITLNVLLFILSLEI